MSLASKFFISYIVVVIVGLAVISASVAYVAPENFSQSVDTIMMGGMSNSDHTWGGHQQSQGMGESMGMGSMWNNTTPVTPTPQQPQITDEELNNSFREAVNDALLKAGIAATLTALAISSVVSLYIILPLKRVAKASRYIAEGHYDQRLPVPGKDAIGQLVSSFNRMAESLAETETMRHQLIGDVSHELKTPLASIKGYMEGLQDGVIAPSPETFQLVQREAERLQKLVFDLQELSRAEAASAQLDLKPYPPQTLVEPVLARLYPQFVDKNIELTCAVPAQLPAVRADMDRIGQVLTNLVGNALQYTPAGGCVTVQAEKRDATIHFAVRDTGVGLTPESLTKVFQRFYRVDKSRSRISGGSGIGLSIVQHLVEAHGGQIWVESPGLNQGSTFYFTLPLA